jgi:antitoxin Phd
MRATTTSHGAKRRPRSPRPSRGTEEISVSATTIKNEFGRYLEKVIQGGRLIIEKHDTAKAVMISVEEFDALMRVKEERLSILTRQFDELFDRMQTRESRHGTQKAFEASSEELGRAAVAAARKNGV